MNSQQSTDRPGAASGCRILRRPEVEAKTGFKRSHLGALIREGRFPKPVRLGVRAIGWNSIEVDQWIQERLKDRV